MEQRLSLVTLGVGDLARATAFYERLGWKRSMAKAEGVAFFQLGGIALALWPRADLANDAGVDLGIAPRHAGVSIAQNVRDRSDVDRILAEAKAAGATIVKPAHDTFYGGHAGYFADPEGFLWEIAWNPGFALAADGSIRLPE